MPSDSPLPPGQVEAPVFFRFGLPRFAFRMPGQIGPIAIQLSGDIEQPLNVADHWQSLPRVEQISDFHCVTSWSRRRLSWSGVRFRDFYEQLVVPLARPRAGTALVVCRGEDGYRTRLPLADLLADDVLLADQLDGQPLTLEHGAPVRLVAPAHYGYKSVKHLKGIEFQCEGREYHFSGFGFMEHPRGRVALQERGKFLPGAFYRVIYRPIIPFVRWLFRLGASRATK